MKIAFLNMSYGVVNRGAETFVFELSKRLEREHRVDVITDKKTPPKRWPLLWRFFIDPAGLSVLWFTLKSIPKMFRGGFDVIIPIDGGWQSLIVRIITWIHGKKMIISGQSGMGWDDRLNLWCFPDYFVALSTQAKNWARNFNPFVKVEYIPNGVDLSKFTVKGSSLHGVYSISLKKPIVLCVGALSPEKRIDLAIKAVANLNHLRGGPERSRRNSSDGGLVSLLVAGDGYLKEELQNFGEKLLDNRLQILKLPFSEMPKVYRLADVFTLPSVPYQSFEIALVEAMATNLPVVANDDPIRREIVGDAGILVDPTNIDEYAKAIQKALDTKWGNNPRTQSEKFDWDIITGKYQDLVNQIVR